MSLENRPSPSSNGRKDSPPPPRRSLFEVGWHTQASCRDQTEEKKETDPTYKFNPDALFVDGAAQNIAKLICRGCPVRTECLADALDNNIEYGVWGGMTERERRALLKRRPDVEGWFSLLKEAESAYELQALNGEENPQIDKPLISAAPVTFTPHVPYVPLVGDEPQDNSLWKIPAYNNTDPYANVGRKKETGRYTRTSSSTSEQSAGITGGEQLMKQKKREDRKEIEEAYADPALDQVTDDWVRVQELHEGELTEEVWQQEYFLTGIVSVTARELKAEFGTWEEVQAALNNLTLDLEEVALEEGGVAEKKEEGVTVTEPVAAAILEPEDEIPSVLRADRVSMVDGEDLEESVAAQEKIGDDNDFFLFLETTEPESVATPKESVLDETSVTHFWFQESTDAVDAKQIITNVAGGVFRMEAADWTAVQQSEKVKKIISATTETIVAAADGLKLSPNSPKFAYLCASLYAHSADYSEDLSPYESKIKEEYNHYRKDNKLTGLNKLLQILPYLDRTEPLFTHIINTLSGEDADLIGTRMLVSNYFKANTDLKNIYTNRLAQHEDTTVNKQSENVVAQFLLPNLDHGSDTVPSAPVPPRSEARLRAASKNRAGDNEKPDTQAVQLFESEPEEELIPVAYDVMYTETDGTQAWFQQENVDRYKVTRMIHGAVQDVLEGGRAVIGSEDLLKGLAYREPDTKKLVRGMRAVDLALTDKVIGLAKTMKWDMKHPSLIYLCLSWYAHSAQYGTKFDNATAKKIQNIHSAYRVNNHLDNKSMSMSLQLLPYLDTQEGLYWEILSELSGGPVTSGLVFNKYLHDHQGFKGLYLSTLAESEDTSAATSKK